jgi:hypothetical protein
MMVNIKGFGDRDFVKALAQKSGGAKAPPLFLGCIAAITCTETRTL